MTVRMKQMWAEIYMDSHFIGTSDTKTHDDLKAATGENWIL